MVGRTQERRTTGIRRGRWLAVAATVGTAEALAVPSPHPAAAPVVAVAPLAPAADAMAMTGSAWLATWATAPVAPLSHGRSAEGFDDQTVRQVVRTSMGGPEVRVRLTNAFGTRPVDIEAASVAVRATQAQVVPGTLRALTVAGDRSFTLAPGATVTTDAVAEAVGAGADLAISLSFAGPTGPATWHPLALTTGYVATGDEAAGDAYTSTTSSWWFLAGVDVLAPKGSHAVVAFGASTSDGEGSGANADARWLDDLNRRLDSVGSSAPDPDAVVDEGIAGNRLLSSGPADGMSGDARFGADVLDQPGVAVVIVSSLGNDDIGHCVDGRTVTAAALIAGYRQLIAQAHAAGIRIIGATLTPDQGARMWTAAGEAVREQVNTWILTSHAFDATIDFARAVADPAQPTRLAPAFDSGDHLHPNAAGYRAIAAAISPAILAGGPAQAM